MCQDDGSCPSREVIAILHPPLSFQTKNDDNNLAEGINEAALTFSNLPGSSRHTSFEWWIQKGDSGDRSDIVVTRLLQENDCCQM